MFHESHETWVDSLKRHLSAWKKESGRSEMTLFDEIVAAHVRIGGPLKTGIRFNDGEDTFNRQKANAMRIKRLLSDEPVSDEQADQLVNLMPSILAALPAHLRISFLNEYLSPLDLHVVANDADEEGEVGLSGLTETLHKDSRVHQTMAAVIQNPDIATLKAAQVAIQDAIETKKKHGRIVTAMLRAKTGAGAAIKAAIKHACRKEKV
jgi:hypothetical protein